MSALDVHVGRHVFKEAILQRLVKEGRTVVLVSHQLQYLQYADKVSGHCFVFHFIFLIFFCYFLDGGLKGNIAGHLLKMILNLGIRKHWFK